MHVQPFNCRGVEGGLVFLFLFMDGMEAASTPEVEGSHG